MSFKQKHINVLILDDSSKTIDSVNNFPAGQLNIMYRGTNVSRAINNVSLARVPSEEGNSESISQIMTIDMQFFSLSEFVTIISTFEEGICLIFVESSDVSILENQIELLKIIFSDQDGESSIDFRLKSLPVRAKDQVESKIRDVRSLIISEIKKIPDRTKEQQEMKNRESILKSLNKDSGSEIDSVDYSDWATEIVEEDQT